ncbi:MAG: hypothetical protein J6J61_06435 [Muribaculaceae bacterium]|nr:hypothetical protein [Muribaculaceae bacterium]
MIESKNTPKWAQIPVNGASCHICGNPVCREEEHEVVKTKRGTTLYLHTSCIAKERQEIRKAREASANG